MIYSDKHLSQRLERTEARASAAFVEARAARFPESGAARIEVAGAYAMFDGPASPLTQTFGLGLFEDATDAQLDTLEAFFAERGAPVFHEVSPLADASLLERLPARGYRPCELTSVMFQPLAAAELTAPAPAAPLTTRIAAPDEAGLWARTSADGWATEMDGLADFMFEFGRLSAVTRGGYPFLAELDGRPIAAGMLFIYDDVAMLAGASTVPEGRRRGAQTALLDARLRFAAARGCRLATMGATPGSQSQRNAEKNGFRIAYTRMKWQRGADRP